MPETPASTSAPRKTATKRSTAAKKPAATRSAGPAAEARKRSAAAKKAAETRAEMAKSPVDRVQEYAGRALDLQVGAALIARDVVTEAVDGLRISLPTREKAEQRLERRRARLAAEMKRYESRGTTARSRFQREVLSFGHDVTKQVDGVRKDVSAQAGGVTSRVETLVQDGLTAGQRAATTVQHRITSLR